MTIAPPSPFRAELRETLRLGAPLAAANLLQMAVYAVDVIFVARLGQEALAASSLAVALYGLLMWGCSGLTGAVAPLIATEMGRRRHAVREVRRSVRMALWLAMACAIGGFGLCLLGERIMLATGQDPRVSARAGAFLAILGWALTPMIACNVFRIFLSAAGRPFYATAITALAILVNAAGNYALVYGHFGAPALGLDGSALSSIATAVFMTVAYVAVIQADRRLRRYRIFGRWWRPEWSRLRDLVRIGAPIAATVVAEGGLFGAAAFLMGRIGEGELAGHTVALQVAALAFQVPFGVGQAATIRVGFHFGAGDRDGVGRAGWAAMIVGVSFVALAGLAMIAVPRLILSAYVDVTAPANAAMVSLAVQYLAVAAAFQLFDGAQAIAAGTLRGLQDTRVPMLIALFSYWVPGFGVSFVLGLMTPLGGLGVWVGLASGLVVASGFLVYRFQRRERIGLLPPAAALALSTP